MSNHNDFVASVLDVLRRFEIASSTYLYKQQVEAVGLDFTLDSLDRLDQCLRNIRKQHQPDYDTVCNTPEGQTFVYLIAAYLMSTIAKAGRYQVKWFNYQEFAAMVPADQPPTYCFETSAICLLDGRVRMALAPITDLLIHPEGGSGLKQYANQLLQSRPDYCDLYIDVEHLQVSDESIKKHQVLFDLASRLGWLRDYATPSSPTAIEPVLLAPKTLPETGITIVKFALETDPAGMLHEIENNPMQKPWLVGVYDSYIYPFSGKTDGMCFQAQSYQDDQSELKILLPYQFDEKNKCLILFNPMLIGDDWTDEQVKVISKGFFSDSGFVNPIRPEYRAELIKALPITKSAATNSQRAEPAAPRQMTNPPDAHRPQPDASARAELDQRADQMMHIAQTTTEKKQPSATTFLVVMAVIVLALCALMFV
jgi:hypothetical protein